MKLFFNSLILSLIIFILNEKGHDFLIVQNSFNKGEFKFGYFLHFLQYLKVYIDVKYIQVHFLYIYILSYSLLKLSNNKISLLILIIFPFSDILNEQIRFFSALFFAISHPIKNILSFLIHPAAALIALPLQFFKKSKHIFILQNKYFFLVMILTAFLIANLISPIVHRYSILLGYDYQDSIHFGKASYLSLLIKIIFCFIFYFIKSREIILFYLLFITITFGEIAIISGRSLIAFLILITLFFICFDSQKMIITQKKNFFIGLFSLIIIYVRFYD
jgi:hypothetical protein